MLTITPRALSVIERVTDHPRLEPTSGLRIARCEDSSAGLEVRAVSRPCPGDSVIERPGARLYVDEQARSRVDGCELDVKGHDEPIQFVLRNAA